MRQTFVVVTIVLGLLLWVVAAVYAEPGRCRLAVLQASAGYGRTVLAARQRCEESLLKGKSVPWVNGLFGVNALQVTPDGKHVYAAGTVLSSVVIFARDAATGALTFLGLERDGQNGVDGIGAANSIAIRPDSHEVFVTGPGDSAVGAFGRDAVSGALAFHEAAFDGNGAAGLGGATGVAVSPDGTHLYVTGTTDDAVAVFAIHAP